MTRQEFLYLAECLDAAQTFGSLAAWNAKEGHPVAAQNAAYAAAHALHRAQLIAGVRNDHVAAAPKLYPWENQRIPLPLNENSGGENAAKATQPVE